MTDLVLHPPVAEPLSRCLRCGKPLEIGDWPFCGGKPEDHVDPHYAFTWGRGGPFTRKS